ncbi:MAG: cupin domain-containing protein [Candidatus Promineifilaceae bacterium]
MENYLFQENLENLLTEIPADSIISRSVLKNEQVDVTLFGFAAGQELTEHTSSRPAILHFIKGKARLTLGEDEKTAEGETWVYMPPRLPHSITAETPVIMLLILLRA